MASGSFILHGSRNSVGNLVTYKRDGKQIVREKATNVSNPRTAGQANQRSLFAPAAKFYSPLSVMLEKSFEGLSKSQSYSKFLANAIKDARSNGWYVPKDSGFFPLPYLISDGTIRSFDYTCDVAEGLRFSFGSEVTSETPDVTTIGDLSQLFVRMGYLVGDQVTLFLVGQEADGSFYPVYDRFLLAPDSTVTLDEALVSMEIAIDEPSYVLRFKVSSGYAAGAIIISRFQNNVWRRSTQRVALNDQLAAQIVSLEWKESAIASYMDGASGEVFSNVYLNGSTINNQGAGGSVGAGIQLTDGTAFTPGTLVLVSGAAAGTYAYVSGYVGTGSNKRALVKIGADFLLTKTTKGALPESLVTTNFVEIDGTQPAMKEWLSANGVAQSVFQ